MGVQGQFQGELYLHLYHYLYRLYQYVEFNVRVRIAKGLELNDYVTS
jgi:hypothetical protein